MKKAELRKMKTLTATPKMMKLAAEDTPKKTVMKTYWGSTYERDMTQYGLFLRCQVQNGILKAAFFLPETMRLGGRLPAYELYIHKETADFITYDRRNDKWLDAKLDKINWPQTVSYSREFWIGPKDNALLKRYLDAEKDGYDAILSYQLSIREKQLEARHKRETEVWDKDLAQTPDLPKDWDRWVDKVGIPENFVFINMSGVVQRPVGVPIAARKFPSPSRVTIRPGAAAAAGMRLPLNQRVRLPNHLLPQ